MVKPRKGCSLVKKSVEFPGIFGSGMLAAVKTFQKAHGLAISGICDRETFLKFIS